MILLRRLLVTLAFTSPALAADPAGPPCLSQLTSHDAPIVFRDIKLMPHDEPFPGRPAARQTVVSLSVCAILSGQGAAASYELSYTPVLYATDGHLLMVGPVYRRHLPSNDPMTGSLAIVPMAADIALGTVIDHAKLDPTIELANIEIISCTENNVCGPATLLGSRMEPACLADGSVPPPLDCPGK